MRAYALAVFFTAALAGSAFAQAPSLIFKAPPETSVLPTGRQPSRTGQAPGLVATELSPNVRYFRLVFARGDDVLQGLAEFAEKNNLANSRFTAIGAFESATIALTDASKEPTRVFRATKLNEDMEISAFNGSISRNAAGLITVHAHTVVTLVRNGQVYAGHFVEGKISLTMQMYLEDSPPLQPPAAAAAAR
jgi:predicted DNA-binding protein with PD1-like motif